MKLSMFFLFLTIISTLFLATSKEKKKKDVWKYIVAINAIIFGILTIIEDPL
jgi:uncharacterized membrane protein HdeD (DUF308 family)